MSLDRRLVLKGLAAVGFAMTSLRFAHAGNSAAASLTASQTLAAVTPIVTGSALDSEFLMGVQAAVKAQGLVQNEVIRLRGLDAAVFSHLSRMLQAGEPATLVGLADDASATLILDLVRSAGGRVISIEHHRLDSDLSAGPVAQALGSTLVLQPSAAPRLPAPPTFLFAASFNWSLEWPIPNILFCPRACPSAILILPCKNSARSLAPSMC